MDIKGRRISIIGAVRSGIAAAKLANSKGAYPFVSDISSSPDIDFSISELKESNIPFEIGEHSEKVFDTDLVITSPGVPTNSPVLLQAADKNLKIISEIEFASWFCEGIIIGITGTNGKTF